MGVRTRGRRCAGRPRRRGSRRGRLWARRRPSRERALEKRLAVVCVNAREEEDLRVDPLQRELQLVFVADLDNAVEAKLECATVEPLELAVVVLERRDRED